MKKFFSLLASAFVCVAAMAQAPALMQYSCVVRDTNGNIVTDKTVSGAVCLGYDMPTSTNLSDLTRNATYVEKFTASTDENGSMSIVIGKGQVIFGSMKSAIDEMAANPDGKMMVVVVVDPDGGNNYSVAGQSYLLSVPYALSAGVAEIAKSVGAIPGLTSSVSIDAQSFEGNAKRYNVEFYGQPFNEGNSITVPLYQNSYIAVKTSHENSLYVEIKTDKMSSYKYLTHFSEYKDEDGNNWCVYEVPPFLREFNSLTLWIRSVVF